MDKLPIQKVMLLVHVVASLNADGRVGIQGGYLRGVTDKSLPEGKSASWTRLTWRSHKMIPHSAELVVHRRTSNVHSPGIRRMCNVILAGTDSRVFRRAR